MKSHQPPTVTCRDQWTNHSQLSGRTGCKIKTLEQHSIISLPCKEVSRPAESSFQFRSTTIQNLTLPLTEHVTLMRYLTSSRATTTYIIELTKKIKCKNVSNVLKARSISSDIWSTLINWLQFFSLASCWKEVSIIKWEAYDETQKFIPQHLRSE